MHPHVTSETPDRCPECGMKLLPAHLVDTAAKHGGDDMHASHEEHHHGSHSAVRECGPCRPRHEHAQGHEQGMPRASSGKTTWSR